MTATYAKQLEERPAKEVIYPVTDGRPVGETDAHIDLTLLGKDVLRNFFRDRSDVYVSGNNFIYFEKGNPKSRVSPDGYVVFGVPMKQRDSYKVWEEGGKTPAVVFEYTSRGTKKEDVNYKFDLYEQVLRVPEYFLFDPKGEYLRPRLQGFRLSEGKYLPLPLVENRIFSEQLNLFLVFENNTLRFYNPETGEILRTLAEETELRMAEQRRAAAAEAEVARLLAELNALKEQNPRQ